MTKRKLLLRSSGMAFLLGSVLAVYISLTTFWLMPHGSWLGWHNLLVVSSLLLTAYVGYQHRTLRFSFSFMLLTITVMFLVLAGLYLGSYYVTTAYCADKMVWIPFFYRDYNYHGFQSVMEYLHHKNNFRELLELQVFSFLVGSVMYFAAGSLGYGAKVVIEGMKNSSGTAQPAA